MRISVGKRQQVGFVLVAIGLSFAATSARATPTTDGGVAYDTDCFYEGVPMPPDFFPITGTSLWHYNGYLTSAQSFTGAQRYIYYYESSGQTPPFDGMGGGNNPQGICAVNLGILGSPGPNAVSEINVLCQGSTGKTCFWRWPGFPPITFPLPSSLTSPSGPLSISGLVRTPAVTARISSRNSNDFENFTSPFFGPGDTGTNCNGSTGVGCARVFAGGDEHGFNDGRVAGDPVGDGRQLACSACHAGENMILNHPGTATDFRKFISNSNSYFPTLSSGGDANWPNALVPAYTAGATACGTTTGVDGSVGLVPCDYFPPYNPGPSAYDSYVTGSQCFGACHTKATSINSGGRFPLISAQMGPGDYLCTYESGEPPCPAVGVTPDYVNEVLYPAVTRGMPAQPCSSSTCNGAMPLSEKQGFNGSADVFSRKILGADGQWLADAQSQFYSSSGGAGYQYPQSGSTFSQPNGSTPGQYSSPYLDSTPYLQFLHYTMTPSGSYTELEATSTHFCWVSGLALPTVASQPSPLPTMYLTTYTDTYDNLQHWQLYGSNVGSGAQINAQCAPWGAIFAGNLNATVNIPPTYNVRGWTPTMAMSKSSYVQWVYAPSTTPQYIKGSTPSSVCFISGFDGDFVSNGDTTQAAPTLWWPGETTPNSYSDMNGVSGDGTHWYVQLGNSTTEEFDQVHITCIDIGMKDTYANLQGAGGISVYASSPSYGLFPTAPVFGSACFFTQIVGTGVWTNSTCGYGEGNVATSPLDNQYLTYEGLYQYGGAPNAGLYYGPATVNGQYVINESYAPSGNTCNTDVIWQAQDCLNIIR
jgi:hypothetical protein